MIRLLNGRSVRILGALLAIAGGALAGRAPDVPSAASFPGDPVELATSARLGVDAHPGESAAALPFVIDSTLRSGSSETRFDGGVPPEGRTASRSVAGRVAFGRSSADSIPATYHHAGRLARSGALSSFGTSLPPPLFA